MTDTPCITNFKPSLGDRVQVVAAHGENPAPGSIVDDFGDGVMTADDLGRTWGFPRRWAVALDSGRLVFADGVDLAPGAKGESPVTEAEAPTAAAPPRGEDSGR